MGSRDIRADSEYQAGLSSQESHGELSRKETPFLLPTRLHPEVPKIPELLAGEASRVQNSELATESIGFPSEQSATL